MGRKKHQVNEVIRGWRNVGIYPLGCTNIITYLKNGCQ